MKKAHKLATLYAALFASSLAFSSVARAEQAPATFPNGWKVTETKDSDGDVTWEASKADDKSDLIASLIVSKMGSDEEAAKSDIMLGIKEAVKTLTQSEAGSSDVTTCEAPVRLQLSNLPAASVLCETKGSDGARKTAMILANGKKNIFSLTFVVSSDQYANHVASWDALRNSFKAE